MATRSLKAQIEITADASGVDAGVNKAKRSLADLGTSGAAAGRQAAVGIGAIGEGSDGAATKVDRSTARMIQSIQRTTIALETGGRSSAKFFETIATQRGLDPATLRPYLDALSAVEAKQRAANATIATAARPLQQVGMSAAATSAALRQVPAQITDIITGLQGGQAPLTVLLQQGGQLRDVFGGIRPAAQALGSTLARMVNPATLVAAVFVAIGAALQGGRDEWLAYEKALILSGNAAGTTSDALQDMAARLDGIAGTQNKAAETLALLAGSGRVAAAELEKTAQAAIRFERATGTAVAETVKQFEALGREPVAASLRLNEATRFLTQSTYLQIKALEDAGRTTEAASAAQRAYADVLEQRGAQIEARLGLIERAWRGIKDAAKEAWDAMLSVGRPDSLGEQLKKAQADLELRQQIKPRASLFGSVGDTEAALERGNKALRERIASLSRQVLIEDNVATAQRASVEATDARIRIEKTRESVMDRAAKGEREIAQARRDGATAGLEAAEIEKLVAQIREKYRDKGAGKSALAIDNAELRRDLSALKNAADQMIAIYRGAEAILDSVRASGTLSDREYYEAKRGFINLNTEARQRELQGEIATLEGEKRTGKDRIDIERKIAALQSQLVISRADAAARLTIIADQELAAARQLVAAMTEARQGAAEALADIERAQSRDIAGFGRGNQERDRRGRRDSIDDSFNEQRRRLANERELAALRVGGEENLTRETRAQFDERLRVIDEFQSRTLTSFDAYYAALLNKQTDLTAGVNEAFNNYVDPARRTGEEMERVFTKALGGIEDAFVSLATTGKADFKSLVDSIVADIIRMTVRAQMSGLLKAGGSGGGGSFDWGQLLATVMGLFGGGGQSFSTASSGSGFAGSGGFDFNRADGGPVRKGRMYEVNERGGGELFNVRGRQYLMPAADGSVTPAGGRVLNQTIHFSSPEPTSRRTQTQVAAAAAEGLRRGERNL